MQVDPDTSAIDRAWASATPQVEATASATAATEVRRTRPKAKRITIRLPAITLPNGNFTEFLQAQMRLSPARAAFVSATTKKLVALVVSYEVTTYCLATVQAVGLTLPTMVNSGPSEHRLACQKQMVRILSAAEEWQRNHPGQPQARFTVGDLKPYLGRIPKCPEAGRYELLFPGSTFQDDNGQKFLIPEGRIAVHCTHGEGGIAPHGGLMSNPYQD